MIYTCAKYQGKTLLNKQYTLKKTIYTKKMKDMIVNQVSVGRREGKQRG
jgi:hypothetical protein